MNLKNKNIFVAGHKGMVGSSICRHLNNLDYRNVLTEEKQKLNLLDQNAVNNYFNSHKIDFVFLAAAKVGGIYANNEYPAEFIYNNLLIQSNVINACYNNGIKNLLALGSSCIYPKDCKQPIKEEYLMGGYLEMTNEPYAIAKIAGIKLCESYNRQYGTDYRSIMPTNLYGPNDNFHPLNSHVIPGLIQRMHQAKENGLNTFDVWGSGKARREFLHVDDLAAACLHVAEMPKSLFNKIVKDQLSHINVGTGLDISISELAQILKEIIKYRGKIQFDIKKPDGPKRKLLSIHKLNKCNWKYTVELREGLTNTYSWYMSNIVNNA